MGEICDGEKSKHALSNAKPESQNRRVQPTFRAEPKLLHVGVQIS